MWQEEIVKQRHFDRFLKTNPDIAWITRHIGPPQLRDWEHSYVPERRRYIEDVVKYVDFRDWSKLDVSAPLSVKKYVILNGHGNPSREESRFIVRYHGDESCGEIDPIKAEKSNDFNYWDGNHVLNKPQRAAPETLRDLLGDFWIWHRRDRRCSSIIFDAIVKITRIWDGDWDRYSSETVEIFRVPAHLSRQSDWNERPASQAT